MVADLVISDADLRELRAALKVTIADLEALQRAFHGMSANSIGAAPLADPEATFTSTRHDDLNTLGRGMSELNDQVEKVRTTVSQTDQHLGNHAQGK